MEQDTISYEELGLEISKLISEQESKIQEGSDIDLEIVELILDLETKNYTKPDIEISKLIPTLGQEEEEQEKLSITSCASTLMSFLNQVSDQLLTSAGRSLKFGCPDIEKCLEPEIQSVSSNTKVVSRDNSEIAATNSEIAPPSMKVINTPSSAELNTAPSSHIGQVSILDQSSRLENKSQPKNLDPFHNMPQKTEGVLLHLLDLHVSPTSKIVNRLSQLKKKNLKGQSKRLTRKTPKT